MMGVPIERPRQFADRAFLSDEEFSAREAQSRAQSQADGQVVAQAAGSGRGVGTGPPGHWGERGRPQRQSSLVVDPKDGRIPAMTAEGERRTAAVPKTWYYDNDGGGPFNAPADLSAYDRCITRGVIGSMLPVGYNAGNEIVQAPGYVALRNEMIHETRIIPLDGRPHLSRVIRQYMGDSIGRWEGDTLVVETTNLTDKTGAGANGRAIFHSDALRLTERFMRVDANTLRYELTIDDPVMWTRPWTLAFPLTQEPDYGMFDTPATREITDCATSSVVRERTSGGSPEPGQARANRPNRERNSSSARPAARASPPTQVSSSKSRGPSRTIYARATW